MAFSDAEMRFLNDCDRWRTTPPEEPDAMYECDYCGCELFEGDKAYYIDGKYYCTDCISNAEIELERYSEEE